MAYENTGGECEQCGGEISPLTPEVLDIHLHEFCSTECREEYEYELEPDVDED